jgi:predicted O-methyltransferase YrrM
MSAPEPPGLLFKHKDTQLLVAIGVAFAALSAGAGLLLDDGIAALVALTLLLVALVGLLLHLRRARQAENEHHLRHIQAVDWLHHTLSPHAPLPPLTGWAASPELLCTLVDLIRRREPKRILEAGSGASTLVMAYALEQTGRGRLVALDHLEAYAEQSARQVAAHGLQDQAVVQHAPLRSQQYDGPSWKWYDPDPLDEALDPKAPIDLLVIDGPPRETQPMARYPALPAFFDRLSEDAVVVLDDARRADEQRILKRWQERYPSLDLKMRPSPKGTAVLYRKRASSTADSRH